jgi:OHCU decarboxylase
MGGLPPVERLNVCGPQDFAEGIRPLFEVAPLAEALYARRPFASYEQLIDTAENLALSMPDGDQVAVLAAHPRIGANAATMSAASYAEQGYAAEADLSAAELERVYAELAQLNELYEQRFGFRFVVFVNGRPKAAILQVLRDRLQRSRDEELASGLRDMFCIARDRLARAT